MLRSIVGGNVVGGAVEGGVVVASVTTGSVAGTVVSAVEEAVEAVDESELPPPHAASSIPAPSAAHRRIGRAFTFAL